VLRLGQADVAQVRREFREQELNIGALAIPGHEPVHGEGVPEIVQTWLEVSGVLAAHAEVAAHHS